MVKSSFWFQCVENVSHANCPVCLEDIHTSRIPCHIPDCGHLLHRTCFEDLLHSGHYACPTCQVSLLDMTDLWSFLDSEVSLTPMPPEYKDYKAEILCKDCHEVSTYYICWWLFNSYVLFQFLWKNYITFHLLLRLIILLERNISINSKICICMKIINNSFKYL